jgi:prepilin-type N-terminal cleavage/methylation domain-containing protein
VNRWAAETREMFTSEYLLITPTVKWQPIKGRTQNGFTLVELIIVIAIMGILAAIILTNLTGLSGTGKDEAAAAEFIIVQSSMDAMMAKDGLTSVTATAATNDMSVFPSNSPLYPRFLRTLITKVSYSCIASGLINSAGTGGTPHYLVFSASDNVLSEQIHNATWTTGLTDKGIAFNGTNSYVSVPNSPTFNLTSQISMEAWVYTSEQKEAKIIEKGDWDGQGIDQDKWDGWQAGVFINGDKKYSLDWGRGQPTLNTWYHLAYTYDGSSLRLYVNGLECNSLSVSGSLRVNTRPVTLGADGGTQKFFKGTIDQAGIYNTALSGDQILAHYNALKP